MFSNEAEIIRLRYKYRRLILEGKVQLRPEDAAKLIGPDCTYRLYFSARPLHGEKIKMRKGRNTQ